MTATEILANVTKAMAPAENENGPEGEAYIDLMHRIAQEAMRRMANAAKYDARRCGR